MHFKFRQIQNEDITLFINEMFEILASNMNVIAPTGNSYDADFKIWSECVVPVLRERGAQCNFDFLRRCTVRIFSILCK